MKVIAVLGLLALSSSVSAAESKLPVGCQPVMVQGNTVTIQADKKALVFIHNITAIDMWVTHPVQNPGASAGWTSRLEGGKWAALSLEKGPFALTCIESRPGHEQQVPCEGTIAVCKWNKVKFPENAQGTFWAAENMSLPALKAAVGGRGYVLPQKR
ncbi:hypothetical protein ACD661_08175 [Legionella lytica]|uniref:Enhanced entry protein EnhB n=1 Tax=Legionella lytica TaxID=96232 RepID=A0ABW8D756_9GAMM